MPPAPMGATISYWPMRVPGVIVMGVGRQTCVSWGRQMLCGGRVACQLRGDLSCHAPPLDSRQPGHTAPAKARTRVSAETIACPSCGRKIPLSDALRAEIEASLKTQFDARERALRQDFEDRRAQDLARLEKDA